MAEGNWFMGLSYSLSNTSTSNSTTLYIEFTPTGQTVPSADLDKANVLFEEIIVLTRLGLGDPNFDIWGIINWLFVVFHWATLHNFGQLAPTAYARSTSTTSISAIAIGTPNFTQPAVAYPPTYNIFCNATLFNIYADYLNHTLYNFAAKFGPLYGKTSLPQFLPLSEQNRLQVSPTSFVVSYACSERQIKGWLNLVISVIVADYTFIMGAYSLIIFFGQQIDKLKENKYGAIRIRFSNKGGEEKT
jgi:hypothetical protein